MITVQNIVDVYEFNGKEVQFSNESTNDIKVLSHWNYNDRVVLLVDGKRYTVIAKDLKAAIDNATNVNRF